MNKRQPGKPLLVLDTNVVFDLLHFDDVAARPLLHALEAGRVRCATTDATLEEWRRVLGYPGFALDAARQAALVARYRELSTLSAMGEAVSGMPRCSDPDDQKFIELAAAVCAEALVSKDRAVLKLRRHCAPWFRVMTPAEVVRWLGLQRTECFATTPCRARSCAAPPRLPPAPPDGSDAAPPK